MKETYEQAKMEIIEFETEDIITTSAVETPFMPVYFDANGYNTEGYSFKDFE